MAASGEVSDFQYTMDLLNEMVLNDTILDDDAKLTALEVHSYLTRVAYNRRNKMNPLYNRMLVAGVSAGKRYVVTAAALHSHTHTVGRDMPSLWYDVKR